MAVADAVAMLVKHRRRVKDVMALRRGPCRGPSVGAHPVEVGRPHEVSGHRLEDSVQNHEGSGAHVAHPALRVPRRWIFARCDQDRAPAPRESAGDRGRPPRRNAESSSLALPTLLTVCCDSVTAPTAMQYTNAHQSLMVRQRAPTYTPSIMRPIQNARAGAPSPHAAPHPHRHSRRYSCRRLHSCSSRSQFS